MHSVPKMEKSARKNMGSTSGCMIRSKAEIPLIE